MKAFKIVVDKICTSLSFITQRNSGVKLTIQVHFVGYCCCVVSCKALLGDEITKAVRYVVLWLHVNTHGTCEIVFALITLHRIQRIYCVQMYVIFEIKMQNAGGDRLFMCLHFILNDGYLKWFVLSGIGKLWKLNQNNRFNTMCKQLRGFTVNFHLDKYKNP